ncbi:MAG: hypothetical protein ACRDKT_15685 [Actinomycetota bacterium]
MPLDTLPRRARSGEVENLDTGIFRALDHPVAFIATGLILVALFGWTFFTNPDRVAPTKDPAYYTWRTEALMSEEPRTMVEIEGPKVGDAGGMYAGGYRVTAPVIGSYLRRIGDVATLSTTAVLMVGIPVLTALLLAGFAYQQRRDALIFHAVAFGAASLYLTPPFVGYLDNILALFFLAASLLFIEPARTSGAARIGFATFLLLCGLTHPTTLVIFGVILGAMAVVRLVFRRFNLRSVLRDDGPLLLAALGAAVVTFLIWTIGIWGLKASLSDAALPPPYEASFFVDRLLLWIDAMNPILNGPLFVIGIAGLLAGGLRNAVDDELARVSIVWLAPLAGLFGFVAGLTYPYYRFFNTTLAWVLLVGVGIFFAARFFVAVSRRGGLARVALLGVVALAVIVGVNFRTGFEKSGWNNAQGGWLSADERTSLEQLAAVLRTEGEPRPVVFVTDTTDHSPRVYGATKLVGNTARYGLPPGWLDEAYLYLGEVENFVAGEATSVGQETYDAVSEGTLEDATEAIEASGDAPIVVVAAAFNADGANAGLGQDANRLRDLSDVAEIWVVGDHVTKWVDGEHEDVPIVQPLALVDPGLGHLFRVLGGFILLLLPGALAFRWFLRDGEFAQAVGLVPALSIALLAVVGIVVLAVAQAPFSSAIAWISLVLAVVLGVVLAVRSGSRFRFVRSGRLQGP